MSFAFNFLAEEDGSKNLQGEVDKSPEIDSSTDFADQSERIDHTLDNNSKNSVVWIRDVQPIIECCFRQSGDEPDHETIYLDGSSAVLLDDVAAITSSLRRVREDSVSTASTQQYKAIDLIPGVYEGGLKVWECSLDLCRYLQRHNVRVGGHVLELGCGHGLPGCWILKRALSDPGEGAATDCNVVFSDYNEFVLRDVTVRNVALNAKDAEKYGMDPKQLTCWLDDHVAFCAGDWNLLSAQLLCQEEGTDQSSSGTLCPAVPKSGRFDCILAAETTYSEQAAIETAQFLSKHLTPGTGVAYIATKRYYFGVGGGTSCLCDALLQNQERTGAKFHVETVEVYDDGASNIRELLVVKMLS